VLSAGIAVMAAIHFLSAPKLNRVEVHATRGADSTSLDEFSPPAQSLGVPLTTSSYAYGVIFDVSCGRRSALEATETTSP
jgi:hypothetical protein